MTERKRPYEKWSLSRLKKHQQLIADEITTKTAEIRAEWQSMNGILDPSDFIRFHSDSICNIAAPFKVGEKDIPWNAAGDTFHLDYYAYRCLTHGVQSKQFSK